MDSLPRPISSGDQALFSAIEIEVNAACNRACSYCPNASQPRRSRGDMDPALYQLILRELNGLGFSGRISFHFYNEPLLHPSLEDLVTQARAAVPGAHLELYTNGSLLLEERLHGLYRVGVSRFIVTPAEGDRIIPIQEFMDRLPREIRAAVSLRNISDVKLTNRGGLLKHLGGKGCALTRCEIPGFLVVVTVDGNVLPCFEDFEEKLKMGNIREESLLEIWNSEKYGKLRGDLARGLRHLHSTCSGCNRTQALSGEGSHVSNR